METVRELCSFERRLAGTDAERRAANRLAERLRSLGRDADVEPTYAHPQAPLVWAAHCALAFIGSLVAVAEPAVGFALVLVAATSFYLDANTRAYLLRTLFFRRACQNVVSSGAKPDAPARLILVAHYDAARSGAVFQPRNLARMARWLPFPPVRLIFWSMALLLPALGARMAGLDSGLVSLVQLPFTLILMVAVFALVDIQLSPVAPGANDNASGVAVALSLAAELEAETPSDLDVWIVLSGAQESGLEGMRSFLRARRKELDRHSTYVLALESVGAGRVRWVATEGLTVSFAMDRRLQELCHAIAEAEEEADSRPRPIQHPFATDALAASVRKLRAGAITCTPEGSAVPAPAHTRADTPEAIDPDAMERASSFTLALIRALDRDVARARAAAAAAR